MCIFYTLLPIIKPRQKPQQKLAKNPNKNPQQKLAKNPSKNSPKTCQKVLVRNNAILRLSLTSPPYTFYYLFHEK
jgi:hypothetical protein